jgi:gamma-glutamylaminecyclotransferase
MNAPFRFDVFGREVTVVRRDDGWRACYPGADGTHRLADDLRLPADLALADVPGMLADLCHEWAIPSANAVVPLLEPVFVYGTLREGYPNAHAMSGERIEGLFETVSTYPLLLAGPRCSPCLINEPGTGMLVCGELFRVSLATYAVLDDLERIVMPDGYRRRRIEVLPVTETGNSGNYEQRSDRQRWVMAYLKARKHAPLPHVGLLAEYGLDHAARYQRREVHD